MVHGLFASARCMVIRGGMIITGWRRCRMLGIRIMKDNITLYKLSCGIRGSAIYEMVRNRKVRREDGELVACVIFYSSVYRVLLFLASVF